MLDIHKIVLALKIYKLCLTILKICEIDKTDQYSAIYVPVAMFLSKLHIH